MVIGRQRPDTPERAGSRTAVEAAPSERPSSFASATAWAKELGFELAGDADRRAEESEPRREEMTTGKGG
jgi:hypothetical protein